MDGTLIVQVIINLIENSIFHSGSMDTIHVSASIQETKALFTVRDHGCGVDVQRMERLIEGHIDTEHTGDSTRGMGIGLSLCSAIIKAHGGRIWAQNAEDGGAVFSFELPLQ